MENVNSFLIYSFQGGNIMDEYDRRSFYPMFLKCYHLFHPIIKFVGCVNQFSTNCIPKWANERICHQEIIDVQTLPSGFQGHQMSFQWWAKHEAMSLIACVLAHQILGIVGSQIETIKGILSNLKTYHL
jgi:hypothetical protein